nr:helix-hairpin-helix domain-containing protein [Algoriphagus sp.]
LWSRVEIEHTVQSGLMVLQDIQFGREKWRLTGRMALFDTDDFDSRLYAFENNVLWTFAIPAFSGRGIRNYLVGQYQISPTLTAYLRIARTTYTDREEISSGLQTITGNTQTETSLLLRYFFR